MQKVYLDNAATTPLDHAVIEEMVSAMKNCFGNPSSTHIFGREAKALIELSRKKIANYLNVSPAEIYFTSSGTESNNTIIRSCVQDLGVQRIITTTLEHKCVQETVKDMECKTDVEIVRLDVQKDGNIDYEQFEKLIQDQSKKTLVSLMHANNEIGNLLDIKRISKLCKEHDALFHTDTVQTIGHYHLDFEDLGIDFASCSAHKIHGPKGAGFLFARKSSPIKALITGGGQERNMRSGTENVYGIVGLAKALELCIENMESYQQKIKSLKQYTIDQLRKAIPAIDFNGNSADLENSLYTVLNLKLPFVDSLIGFELELAGIAVSQGSACSSGAAKVSNVMASLYTEEELQHFTPLRVSFSHLNTEEEIDILVEKLKQIAQKHEKVTA
ncbi:cysteine desulfurase family protein [Vaginella massiliensis]|uniref:cysteine desulfurase family protein n=1 Tax=Vaginella massiliensis TaxID=1816680 RepID=UPI000837B31D|nr:cysteine desulfurase family protein [Vaginella massiliensis]